ncbi:MAG: hypothetical protein KBT06_08610 [Prevotellaceae bacterium]|nr:hypothetical protein [Candidatus Colivivens equi]
MRLIDADKVQKPIYAEEDNITGYGMTYDEMCGYNAGIDVAWGRIELAPTVNAVEIVHGHWVKPTVIDGRAFNIPHCSVCNEVPCGVDEHTNYCPNCGAKMDEVRE